MVTELGMSHDIGPIAYQERRNNPFGIGPTDGHGTGPALQTWPKN